MQGHFGRELLRIALGLALSAGASACNKKGSTTEAEGTPDPATIVQSGTAQDPRGNAAHDDLQLTIDRVAPLVDAGSDVSTSASSISRTATATDDLLPLAVEWTKMSGPGVVTFSDATALSSTVAVDTDGSYVLRVTVTDRAGNSAFDEFTYTRVAAGAAVSAGPDLTRRLPPRWQDRSMTPLV